MIAITRRIDHPPSSDLIRNHYSGLKTRMKDQFRSRRVALWLNLIPDLVRSGELEASARGERLDEDEDLEEEYLTYSETLPLIPSIKDISLSKTKLQASELMT